MTAPDKALGRQADLLPQIAAETAAAVHAGTPADATLARLYQRHPEFGSRDRRLFSGAVFAWFRWRGWVEAVAAGDTAAACVLAHVLDSEAIHPAMQRLAGRTTLRAVALRPLGGLDLPARHAAMARMLGATLPPLGALVPPWVAGVLDVPDGTDPESHLMRCLAAFQSRPPTWLRLQRRFAAETLADLQRSDPARVPHPRMPEAVAVPQTAGLPDQLARVKGRVAVQDLASQAVGLVCDPRPGSRWWDVCAGAGGKALHLADLMDDEGTVLATDIRESALAELDRRARAAGLRCLHRRPWDALTDPLPDTGFDGVLVDAPCSGLGTWHRNPDARWRTAQEDVARQAAAQEALLERVADAVRPGGALLYATCTLTRPENNGVVAAFLARRSDFRPAELRSPLTGAPSHGALWIWPWEGPCNGTFVARLKRQSDARAPTA